jgi:hypothetical protein
MKHIKTKELVNLIYKDELNKSKNIKTQKHLLECPECRKELEEMEKFKSIQIKRAFSEPDAELLANSRKELLLKIKYSPENNTVLNKILHFFRNVFIEEKKLVFVGFTALIVGLCIGFFINKQNEKESDFRNIIDNSTYVVNKPHINNLKFLRSEKAGENIDFTFDEAVTLRMSGNINEPKIQKILAYALINEENPGVKLKTISALNINHNSDKIIKEALIQTVKTDDNPGVRSEALLTLSNMKYDEEIRDVLIFVLKNDNNSGIRQKALLCIEKIQRSGAAENTELYNTLKIKMESDDNSFIRYRAKTLIEETK